MKIESFCKKWLLFFSLLILFGCDSSSGGSGSQDGRDAEAPSVPAKPSSFNSDSKVQISWAVSTDNTAVTGYKIYRNGTYLASSTTNSFTDSNITEEGQYCYTVSALDSAGNESASSESTCVDTSNGRVKWRFGTESSLVGSIAVDLNGTIYAADEKNLYAIKPDGSMKWKFTPEIADGNAFYNDATPVIGPDNTIYIQTKNGVCALNMDGAIKPKETAYFCSATGPDGAYYNLNAYILFSLNPDGTEKWRFSPGYRETCTSPAIGADGTVYTATYYFTGHYQNYVLHAISPDGLEKWKNDSAFITTSPVIGTDGSLYVASKPNAYELNSDSLIILALNQDGTIKWKTETDGFIGSSLTIDKNGTLYSMSKDGYLNALKPGGTFKWRCPTGVSDSSPAIGNDGTIYVGSSDKGIYAVSSDSPGLDSNSWSKAYKNNGNSGILQKTVIDSEPPNAPSGLKVDKGFTPIYVY